MRLTLAGLTLVLFILAAEACGGSDRVPVVVANEAIPADTRITADMVKVEYSSPEKAEPDAFSSLSQVIDRVATEDVAAGATIMPSMVSDIVTFSGSGRGLHTRGPVFHPSVGVKALLPAGIRLGDRVDVVGVFIVKDFESANDILEALGKPPLEDQPPLATGETGNRSLSLTVTIYPNLRLLAVPQPLEVNTKPRPTTVNLEATREQAHKIIWADEVGTLRLERTSLVPDCCFSAIGIYDPPALAYGGELR